MHLNSLAKLILCCVILLDEHLFMKKYVYKKYEIEIRQNYKASQRDTTSITRLTRAEHPFLASQLPNMGL